MCDFKGSFVLELFLSNQVSINPACCIFKVALHDVLITRNGGTLQQANNQPLTYGCFSFHQYTFTMFGAGQVVYRGENSILLHLETKFISAVRLTRTVNVL